jgi:hypothetical protein
VLTRSSQKLPGESVDFESMVDRRYRDHELPHNHLQDACGFSIDLELLKLHDRNAVDEDLAEPTHWHARPLETWTVTVSPSDYKKVTERDDGLASRSMVAHGVVRARCKR